MAEEERQRQILLQGSAVSYRLRRSQRRSIGLTVDRQGLRVSAPLRASLRDIEQLLHQHADWVLAKLRHWQEVAPVEAFAISDGCELPLFGEPWRLALDPAGRPAVRFDPATRTLSLHLRDGADRGKALRSALQAAARADFLPRLQYHATQLGVALPPLALSSARTRWGSCSRRGIRLNWRLIHFPPALIDYVVAHEVAHLREMNHGPEFWSIVASLCPEWRHARRQLKLLAPTLPTL